MNQITADPKRRHVLYGHGDALPIIIILWRLHFDTRSNTNANSFYPSFPSPLLWTIRLDFNFDVARAWLRAKYSQIRAFYVESVQNRVLYCAIDLHSIHLRHLFLPRNAFCSPSLLFPGNRPPPFCTDSNCMARRSLPRLHNCVDTRIAHYYVSLIPPLRVPCLVHIY